MSVYRNCKQIGFRLPAYDRPSISGDHIHWCSAGALKLCGILRKKDGGDFNYS